MKADLIEAGREEFERLGFSIPIKLMNEFTPEQNILMREGIIFCTYKSLIAKSKNGDRRVDQVMRRLGAEGLEIFDEGHKAKHTFADEGGKATQTGQAVLEIQDPKEIAATMPKPKAPFRDLRRNWWKTESLKRLKMRGRKSSVIPKAVTTGSDSIQA